GSRFAMPGGGSSKGVARAGRSPAATVAASAAATAQRGGPPGTRASPGDAPEEKTNQACAATTARHQSTLRVDRPVLAFMRMAPSRSDPVLPRRSCFSISRRYTAGPNIGNVRVLDRKSTRLNSSHVKISYAVFCLKKKKKNY